MDVILLEKIDNIGGIGDLVSVKSGFARNFLIPKGKATSATTENVAKFEKIRSELEQKASAEVDAAKARAAQVESTELKITVQAGPEGRLFGSVGTIDIAEAFAAVGIEIGRSEIRLHDGSLRVVGEHMVEIHLHTDVNVTVKVLLEAREGAQKSPLTEDTDEENPEFEESTD